MINKILFIILFLSILISNLIYSQWERIGENVIGGPCTSITSNGNNIYTGTYDLFRSVYISTNNGVNWQEPTLNGIAVNSILLVGSKIFVGTDITPPYSFSPDTAWGDGGVYCSTNNGANWTFAGIYLRVVLSLASDGNNIYAGTKYQGIYNSTDNGVNWAQTSLNNEYVNKILIRENKIYAGTKNNGIYISTNSGINWTHSSLNNKSVYTIAGNSNTVFAGVDSQGVYYSSDNGVNWIQTLMNNKIVNSITTYNNNIFASVFSEGVYYSSNNGSTWILINQGFTGTPNTMCLYIANGYIFAGTAYTGVWRRPLSDIIGIKNISTKIPKKLLLRQNYPNPFNPSTNIRFELPNNCFTKLTVFDAVGKEIETIISEKLQAGIYETSFDGSKLASGIYFYKLTADNFAVTKKMILMK